MNATELAILFLRLEGPLQSWGVQSRHRFRETAPEPTKSGVIGLIACCMGRRRGESLEDLAALRMGVRVDRPGALIRDYHTVGAKAGVMSAEGKVKHTATTGQPETLLTDRFYLCDASFLVALAGDRGVLDGVEERVRAPIWPPFLGRKCCPPSVPLFAGRSSAQDVLEALASHPWRPRLPGSATPDRLRCVVEALPTDDGAVLCYDCPTSFAGPRPMRGRYVRETFLDDFTVGEPVQVPYRPTRINRMNYGTRAWRERRHDRGEMDGFLCVFCKLPSLITHHITYRRARNEDVQRDLRSVCRRCHDAITMLESERGLGLDRIDPLLPHWRDLILSKRAEIEEARVTRRDPERTRR